VQTSQRWIVHRIGQVVAILFLETMGSTAVWARGPSTIVVTGYGPGVAGQVIEGPTTPVCRPNVPCTRPFANATVLVRDSTSHNTIGTAVTNRIGNFLVSVPSGAYVVHVQVVDLPRCPEVPVTVGPSNFAVVHVSCDTGIR
jgi:hypothetical protein